jgi:predicted nuclease of predicted toxin-antitoxin system
LPKRFCIWLKDAGHDAIHTLDLPSGNRTTDQEILEIAKRENRTVITKDDDFVQSYLLTGYPPKLLLIATGNIGNTELEKLILTNLDTLANALETSKFIEIGRSAFVVHE